MQRYRAAVHVPQPSLFHSLIFWHSSQYLPRCNAAVNYRCRGADEQCEGRKGKSESENVGLHKRRDWAEANRTLVLLNVWICIGVQIIPTPPKGGGSSAVGGESMQIRACVPKIRAHNLEDISCSTLMVIGESVSSDCCLKDERLQCLSSAPRVRKYYFFLLSTSLIVGWHLTWHTTIKALKTRRGTATPAEIQNSGLVILSRWHCWKIYLEKKKKKSIFISAVQWSPLWQRLVIRALFLWNYDVQEHR